MKFSHCLTVADIELINLAIQRKLDHYQKQTCGMFLFEEYLLSSDDPLTETFTSESLHHPLEKMNGKKIDIDHSTDYCIVKRDLDSYLRFAFQRAEFIPLKTNERSSKISPLKRFNRMLSLDYYKYAMSSLLRKMIKKIVPRERGLWIVHLLLCFHYGHECRFFVTTALKVFFEIFKFFPINFYLEHLYDNLNFERTAYSFKSAHMLQRYVKIIQRNCCTSDVLATALKIFYFHADMNACFFKYIPDIKYVLETAQNANMEIPKFFGGHEIGRLKSSDLCLDVDWQHFVSLVQFGAPNVFSKEEKNLIKNRGWHETDFDLLVHNRMNGNPVVVYDHYSLRLHQVVNLFLKSQSDEALCNEAEFVLRLLWGSIPDPYLTLEEVGAFLGEPINIMRAPFQFVGEVREPSFLLNVSPKDRSSESLQRAIAEMTSRGYHKYSSRSSLIGTPLESVMIEAWEWYKKNLLLEHISLKSPRNLKHLSRCVVRQSLALNFQLPKGVTLLNLPKCIQDYLLLKDCGSNPYEEKFYLMNTLERLHTDCF